MRTIVFGAGASVPFFNPSLNTSYLTNKVCDIKEWDRVINKYKRCCSNNTIVSATGVLAVINDIKKYLPNANFEQIAEIVDKISSYGFDHVPIDNMMNLQLRVMSDFCSNGNNIHNVFGSDWRDVPFLYREIIAESILDLERCHKVSHYDVLLGLQHDFIDAVSRKTDEISVLSFNYDDCVIDSLTGLGFEKGFELTDTTYVRQINPEKLMTAKKAAYFPHGHVKFHFTDNDNVTFWSDSNNANDERWMRLDSSQMGSTLTVLNARYAYNFNTFITTGQTKDDSLNHLPYSLYYQKLAVDLANSEVIYLIGYSFGDDHVNRLLQSFLKMNTSNRIVVVDYYPYPVQLVDEYMDDNIISRIHTILGTTWQLKVENGIKKPFDQANVNIINKVGYGKIFDQVIFYKKGYEEFLKEYSNVI